MRVFRMVTTLVLGMAAAGCGAGDTTRDTAREVKKRLDPVAAAAEKTTATGGARIEARILGHFRGEPIPMEMNGAVSFDENRMRLELDYPPEGIPGVPADALATAREEADFPYREILDGDEVFISTPSTTRKTKPSKPWVHVDLAEVDDEAGLDLAGAAQLSEMNPEAFLRFLRTTGGSREAGSATVDGARTTRYTGTMDIARYPETVPPDRREAAERTAKLVAKAWGTTTQDYTVWVDGEGIVRRERLKFQMTEQGDRMRVDMDIRFKEVGRPQQVELPPRDDVLDITDQAVEELGG
jgi:hypothetical protein